MAKEKWVVVEVTDRLGDEGKVRVGGTGGRGRQLTNLAYPFSQTGPSVSVLTHVQADDKSTKICLCWECFEGRYTEKPQS